MSTGELADNLRYTGLALQILGVGLAAYGIRQVRVEWTELLGIIGTSTSTTRRVAAAVKRRVEQTTRRFLAWVGRPQHVTIQGEAAISAELALSGTLTLQLEQPPAGATLEQRVEWLERRVRTAFEHAENTRQRLDEEAKARADAVAAEAAARAEHTEQVQRSIGRLAGGGLRLQAWGVACLLVGITLATIPEELAKIG